MTVNVTPVLITVTEAAKILGLKSRGGIYRKIQNGELPSEAGDNGPMIERSGLEEKWLSITRVRADSPPLRSSKTRTAPKAKQPEPRTDLPDYNESRRRSEFEKANLLELDRKQKEGLLLPRQEVEQAQAAAIGISKTLLLGVPSKAKQRIPHLTLEEVEILTGLVREALEQLANWDGEA